MGKDQNERQVFSFVLKSCRASNRMSKGVETDDEFDVIESVGYNEFFFHEGSSIRELDEYQTEEIAIVTRFATFNTKTIEGPEDFKLFNQ